MKILLFLLLILSVFKSSPQSRRDAVWCFGDSALVDFNQNPPIVSWCSTRSRGTSCSITDSAGNLLFYCNTAHVPYTYDKLGVIWNRNNQIMENGDSLVGDGWYQEMVIIPDPNFNNQYYLFHTGVTINGQLYYSKVDLNFNNGLGRVILKNVLLDSLDGEIVDDGIAAVKHGNGRDWWLIFRTAGNIAQNSFHKFLITPNGIQNHPIQNIGSTSTYNAIRIKFNPLANKLVITDGFGLIELFEFDRCSGNLSNEILIHSEMVSTNSQNEFFCAEFSQNSSLLYVSTGGTTSYLYQFDLTNSNIYSSKFLLDSLNYPIGAGGSLRLAIDGKIYVSRWSGFIYPFNNTAYSMYNMNLSVINNPDVLGIGCNFQPYSFNLGGKRTCGGLPNNPYYDMPALGGSACDTLGLPNGIRLPQKNDFALYPNPARDKIYFNTNIFLEEKPVVKIFDLTGKLLFEKQITENVIDFSKFSQGLYTISFFVRGVLHSSVKISVIK